MPLLLAHGWSGSVFEFTELIPRLTDPGRSGGDADDAFTVVAPSLPGYGLSFAPDQPRFSVEQMADAFATLMVEVLGYPRFATQGGDWGASVASRLGFAHPEKTIGVHLNLLPLRRDPADVAGDSPAERQYRADLKHWIAEETGYSTLQGTRPQTLAYAHRFARRPCSMDCREDARTVGLRRRRGIRLRQGHWFTGAIGSSFWPYYARAHGSWPLPEGRTVDVPRSLAERTYNDIRRWSVMPRGGHFAAMEQPEALAREIRLFYRRYADANCLVPRRDKLHVGGGPTGRFSRKRVQHPDLNRHPLP